jgi:hypothetical protein
MPNLVDNSLQGFVLGDTLTVFRTVTKLPASRTLAKAYMTLKPSADSDNSAADTTKIWQKEITVTDNPGVGQILDAGSGTGDDRQCRVRFDLMPADTFDPSAPLVPQTEYEWDIQLKLDNGAINTPFKGKLKGVHGVTNKIS